MQGYALRQLIALDTPEPFKHNVVVQDSGSSSLEGSSPVFNLTCDGSENTWYAKRRTTYSLRKYWLTNIGERAVYFKLYCKTFFFF